MLVFVYGTLKMNGGNNVILNDAPLIGEVRMLLPYKMFNCGYYPALVPSDDLHCISGEVFEIDEYILRKIDLLEGYPYLYNKTTLITEFGEAFVYYMETCEKGMSLIPQGIY